MFAKIDFSKLDVMDALDLAIFIEIEALERYQLFAQQIGYTQAGSTFQMMAGYEAKHGEKLSEQRKAMFGEQPTRVRKDLLYDVEAPEVGAVRADMSQLKACQVALSSEKKAYAFYDAALPHVKSDEVKKLFLQLRDEETQHVEMLEKIIAELPPSAAEDLVDADEY